MLNTIVKNLGSSQLHELEKFGSRVNKLGANFAVCDTDGELVLLCNAGKFSSDSRLLTETAMRAFDENDDLCRFGHNNQILAAVLKSGSKAVGAALIDLGNDSSFLNPDVSYNTDNTNIQPGPVYESAMVEMLAIFAENFQAAAKAEQQIEMVGIELTQVYEELILLHKLSANMKVTERNGNFLQMACDSLTDIVNVDGIAILMEKTIEDQKRLVLTAGSGLIDLDEWTSAVLYDRLEAEIDSGKEALLDSEVDSSFKYDWPKNIKNIIAVPLFSKDKAQSRFARKAQNGNWITGLMVAVNRIDKPDFDTIDVKLFNSVANDCAVFIENGRLFGDLKELFIALLKALTSSIDAKDRYTRGHSERVAFISRWIAERLTGENSLEEEQIHKIYLAGLLHDIGKIAINEAVLCKDGKLTEKDLNSIKKHPSIGAGILRVIKQMRDIVPGVLSHHERIDGKGYPNGLVADQIPLIGRIVGLADSFDAMTSERTYRNAMSVEQAMAEIKKGLGTQFDEKVGRVFLDSDVYQLWDIIQSGPDSIGIYGSSYSVEYGTAAVGTLIR